MVESANELTFYNVSLLSNDKINEIKKLSLFFIDELDLSNSEIKYLENSKDENFISEENFNTIKRCAIGLERNNYINFK